MRWSCVLTLACIGCSSSSTNDSQNPTGGSGGVGGVGAGGSTSGGNAGTSGSGGTAAVGNGGSSGSGGSAGAAGDSNGGTGGTVGCTSATITINEVSTKGSSLADEYIELYNPLDATSSLANYSLRVAGMSGGGQTIWAGTGSTIIEAKSYYVIGGADFVGPQDASIASAQSIPEAGGVGLYVDVDLADAVGWGVDPSHEYVEGQPANNARTGLAMARFPNGEDCNDNQTDFVSLPRTPKGSNAP